jgi:hypothetical protein
MRMRITSSDEVDEDTASADCIPGSFAQGDAQILEQISHQFRGQKLVDISGCLASIQTSLFCYARRLRRRGWMRLGFTETAVAST